MSVFDLYAVEVAPESPRATSERAAASSIATHVHSSRLSTRSKDRQSRRAELRDQSRPTSAHVCCADTDTVYNRRALLTGMRLIVRDPATVVGVTIQVMPSRFPERTKNAEYMTVDSHAVSSHGRYSTMFGHSSRRGWLGAGATTLLCSVGAFAIWRPDVLLGLGGFSTSFSCEDIEFTFRVHEHFRSIGQEYMVHSLPEPVAVTEAPQGIRSLVSQRARWQRVIAETVWHYRHMLWNPRYGTVGFVGMSYYILAEVLAPVFQALAVALFVFAAAVGILQWGLFVRLVIILALANAIFTYAVFLLEEPARRTFRVERPPLHDCARSARPVLLPRMDHVREIERHRRLTAWR